MKGSRPLQWVVATGLFLWCLGGLLQPEATLIDRDLAAFHWPLRSALEQSVDLGTPPTWNPGINGGQPILSNPNYAAYYPPTWLCTLVGARYSINLLILLHSAWSMLGAYQLSRRLGSRQIGSWVGALGFGLSPWLLGLSGTLTFYCGMAWWPWVTLASLVALGPGTATTRRRASMLTAAGLAIQLLAGEPVVVLITALSLLALAGTRKSGRVAGLGQVALIGALSALLAASLLFPTTLRVAESERIDSSTETLTTWSLPLLRIPEIAIPRLWGDPMRDEEGLHFGWTIHDRAFPYVASLQVGLVLLLPALGALFARPFPVPIPHRRGWRLMVILGFLLALGSHLPWIGEYYGSLPLLNLIRYPEKFVVLALAALSIAGGLALDSVMDGKLRGRALVALAVLVALLQGGLASLWWLSRDWGETFVRKFGDGVTAPDVGISYMRHEVTLGFLLSLCLAGLLLRLRSRSASWPNPDRRASNSRASKVPVLLLVTLLIFELGYYSNTLLLHLPLEDARQAPEPLGELPAGSRIVTTTDLVEDPPHLRIGPPRFQQSLGRLRQLDPYSGNLFGLSHVLNRDFDLMATSWATHARRQFTALQERPTLQRRLAGAWNAAYSVDPKTRDEIRQEYQNTGVLPIETRAEPIPERLPAVRSVDTVVQLRSTEEARDWLESVEYRVGVIDSCVRAGPAGEANNLENLATAHVQVVEDLGSRLTLEYKASGPGYLVFATTFDKGWRATLEDLETPLAPCPTALGQIGLAVPSGRHQLTLRYREPWVAPSAWISLLTVLGLSLVEFRSLRHTTT